MNSTKERRIEKGLCVRCGKRPPKENRRNCKECDDKQHAKDKELREKLKSLGICYRCDNKIDRESNHKSRTPVLCKDCAEDTRNYHSERTLKCVEELKCRRCAKHLDTDGIHCLSCREKIRAYREELSDYRRENGLCLSCGNPTMSKYLRCRKCLDKRNYSKRRKTQYDYLS